GPEVELDGRLRFARTFFDGTANVEADVVLCRHVIEHVVWPLELLRGVRSGLGGWGGPRVFFETPCLEWILRGQVIWDFFYEHCSLFTARSLTTALPRTGFTDVRVRHVFAGQYLWLEARAGESGGEGDPDSLLGTQHSVPGTPPPTRGPAGDVIRLARWFSS